MSRKWSWYVVSGSPPTAPFSLSACASAKEDARSASRRACSAGSCVDGTRERGVERRERRQLWDHSGTSDAGARAA